MLFFGGTQVYLEEKLYPHIYYYTVHNILLNIFHRLKPNKEFVIMCINLKKKYCFQYLCLDSEKSLDFQ